MMTVLMAAAITPLLFTDSSDANTGDTESDPLIWWNNTVILLPEVVAGEITDPYNEVLEPPESLYTDEGLLYEKEARLVTVKIALLKSRPISGSFDSDHLRSIHRFLFEDIYDWAGMFRTVDIAIGIPFCLCQYIGNSLDALFRGLHDENCLRGIRDADVFAERLAYYLGELNVIHPFREGNGRTQRLFMEQLAYSSGWDVDLNGCGRQAMSDASEAAMMGDYHPLSSIILRTLRRRS